MMYSDVLAYLLLKEVEIVCHENSSVLPLFLTPKFSVVGIIKKIVMVFKGALLDMKDVYMKG